jgi:septal ring factor EnvC (AmiA/AmiB activator)
MSDLSNRNQNDSAPARSRGVLPWIVVLVLVAIAGAFLWANNRNGSDSPHQVAAVQPKAEPSPAPVSDETRQAVTALQQNVKDLQQNVKDIQQNVKGLQDAQQRAADQISDLRRQLATEQGDRKLLSDQVGALSARMDNLANAQATGSTPQAAKKKRGPR